MSAAAPQSLATDREAFARQSRSFAWAARFLAQDRAAAAASLYAFCRGVDDLADEQGAAGLLELARLEQELLGGQTGHPLAARLAELEQRLPLDREAAITLVRTCRGDQPGLRVADPGGLVRYGYGVASTVGLLVCPLLGVRDLQRAAPFAIDLGIGMQLTNICRDVLEDARRDRIYLPRVWTGALEPAELLDDRGDARSRAYSAVLRVLDLAARYYRSADRGMRWIPARPRLAIMTAARIYEAIGGVIRRRGPRYWRGRAYVGRPGKLWHTARACVAWLKVRRSREPARHDATLHVPLRGLPGADPGA